MIVKGGTPRGILQHIELHWNELVISEMFGLLAGEQRLKTVLRTPIDPDVEDDVHIHTHVETRRDEWIFDGHIVGVPMGDYSAIVTAYAANTVQKQLQLEIRYTRWEGWKVLPAS